MQLNPAEISELIKSRIEGLAADASSAKLFARSDRQRSIECIA